MSYIVRSIAKYTRLGLVLMLLLITACTSPSLRALSGDVVESSAASAPLSRASQHRLNAVGGYADTTTVKAVSPAAEALFDSVGSVLLPAIADVDSFDVLLPDTIAATLLDSIPADTARYIIVHEDTVYLGRAGYTGVDTTAIDSSRQSSNALDAPVHFTASDSVTFDYVESRANLHGAAKVTYTNLEIQAELITMSIDSSTVHAHGVRDTSGKMQTPPVFKQGDDEYEPDAVSYNFKSRKAFVNNVFTKQGEGYMASEESKRDSSGLMYIRRGRYTTCEAKHPHFYVAMTRAKMRPGKSVVFGPAYLVVEDVPLPLAIPYGFFPFTSSYSSGIIMPTYGDETTRGFYLRDGGYYFAINDKLDLKVLGEIYTKGSWGLSGQSTYKKRYKFSGNFNFSYQHTQEGEKNMPDFSVSKSFKLQWSHRQDAKANPAQSLSASVNFATSSYERNNLTSMYNPQSYTQSTRTSSVAYTRTFSDIGLTVSATMNLSQNMRDSTISMTMPSLNISLARLNPFKRRKMVGAERWYEKIAMSYTGTFSNSISTKEDKLVQSSLIRDWRNGMRHSVPVSASFTLLNYINMTPSFNFNDRMYAFKVNRSWDTDAQIERLDTAYGFRNVYDYSMGMSASTKLYGTYTPLIGHKISAIRHVFTPTISLSYSPDFGAARYGYYDTYVKTDAQGNVSTVSYSPYQGMLYGVPGKGKTGSISMDISNNVEMKLRTDKDSTGYKKISLIDELGANMSYNMAAKTRPWSDLNTRLRIKLGKNKTYSFNAQWATYAYEIDENGRVYVGETTEYSHGRFGRFQGMSQNWSYTFNNQTFTKLFGGGSSKSSRSDDNDDDDSYAEDEDTDINESNMDPDLQRAQRGARRSGKEGELDADGYVKFRFPWSFSISYGLSVRENTSGRFNTRRMRYPYALTHTLNFSGNMQIASGWNISWSSGYDFNYHKVSMTTASLSRDLHCFGMSCSMVLSPYTSFNFTFAAKASTLADALKWRKQSSYSRNINWY